MIWTFITSDSEGQNDREMFITKLSESQLVGTSKHTKTGLMGPVTDGSCHWNPIVSDSASSEPLPIRVEQREHGRGSRCKDCGGGNICEHQRQLPPLPRPQRTSRARAPTA
jgi:hypothetical protein